ncbi:MAG: DegQ family serine endoprotease [Rhodospirillales bacterium]|nr:DegQ family serine endoprotease [Rhodospirillales bacterium]
MMRIFALALLALAALPAWAQSVPQSRDQIRFSFAPLAKQTAPAVVNIYTRKVVQTRQMVSPFMNDPFFQRFFGEQFGMGMPQERIQRSLGSGVIVGAEGVIVTNHHVIKDSDEITVVLSDRREFEAQLVGSDERTDLAVLRIQTKGEKLPALDWGDSDALEVGDLVLAIGNPFGVGQTVTSGIVSALARTTAGITDFQFFIQTDAAINPGNSGGALITMDGKLVGINTAIYSRDGGSIGIGFAIPAAMGRSVVGGILATGKPIRPWLGAAGQTVTAEIAQSLGLTKPMGVFVNNLHPGGPAEKAGFKKGDLVVAVNGRAVENSEALRFRIATLPVNENAQFTVRRGGKETLLTAKMTAPPDTPPRDLTEIGGRNAFTGSLVANINPALIEEMGIDVGETGVIILRIKRGSPAHRVQLAPGDIVLKVNDTALASVADLTRAIERLSGGLRITVKREGRVMTIQVGGG